MYGSSIQYKVLRCIWSTIRNGNHTQLKQTWVLYELLFLLCNVMLFKYHFKAVHSHKINWCLVGGMCSTQANMNLVETANSAQFYSVHVSVLTSHIIWNELEHFISDMNMNKTQTHQNKHQFSTNLTCEALLFPLRFHVQVTYPSQSHRSKYFWLVTWTC